MSATTTDRNSNSAQNAPLGTLAGQTYGTSQNMWAVAWRQHRRQITAWLGFIAVLIGLLVWFRQRVIAAWDKYGCTLRAPGEYHSCTDDRGWTVWWNSDNLSSQHELLVLAVLGAPLILGVLAATVIFTREFSHGTHVFALTQSAGRLTWFAVKSATVLAPLTGGLLVLGFTAQWVDATVDETAHMALDSMQLLRWSVVPAAAGLLGFACGIAVGMFTRNMVSALVVASIAGGLLLVAATAGAPYVLTSQREAVPLTDLYADITQEELDANRSGQDPEQDSPATDFDPDELVIRSGFLGADRQPLAVSDDLMDACYAHSNQVASDLATDAGLVPVDDGMEVVDADSGEPVEYINSAEYQNAIVGALRECMTELGIHYHYYDYLPGTMLWPLRGVTSGTLVILSAVVLLIAVIRFPRAVAKR